MGHSLKSRSYQVRVKNIHHWMSYSTQKWQIWGSCSEAGSCHIQHPRQGETQDFSQGVGAHYTSKLKNWEKETLSQSFTCGYALSHAYHPVCITWQVFTRSCAGSVEAIESDKLREHLIIWKGTRKNVTDVYVLKQTEKIWHCEPV